MPAVPWQMPGALLQRRWPRTPDELGACEQQLLVEVVGGRDHDPRRAAAPLQPDLTGRRRQLGPFDVRPVREPVLAERRPREQRIRVPLELCPALGVEQRPERLDIPDQPVRRVQAPVLLAVQALRPVALGVPPRPERLGAGVPRFAPALVARQFEHQLAPRRGFPAYPTSRLRPRCPRSPARACRGRRRARRVPSGARRRGGSRSRPRAAPTPSATAARPLPSGRARAATPRPCSPPRPRGRSRTLRSRAAPARRAPRSRPRRRRRAIFSGVGVRHESQSFAGQSDSAPNAASASATILRIPARARSSSHSPASGSYPSGWKSISSPVAA